jgi:type I restriction-modification system DNA methylase subunit
MLKILKSSSSTPSSYAIKNKPDVGKNLIELFVAVNDQFNQDNIDLNMFSDAYEEWKTSSDGNSNKLSDQHFTPSGVQSYIVSKLNPLIDDLFYEPCGGGGGMAIQFKRQLSDTTIFDSTCEINEINPEIHRLLFANMLINQIPLNDDEGDEKIKDQDSLEADYCTKILGTKTVIATNPPFSLKDSLDYTMYFGPLKAGKKCIKNGTALFIIHCIQSLKIGGRCGIVISRDILLNGDDKKNSWEKKFREHIFNQVDIHTIVLLKTGIFPFTNYATAILFFDKNGKTNITKIINSGFINEQLKTGIKEEEVIAEITYAELKKREYNLSKYIKPEIIIKEQNNDMLVRLGDIIQYVKYESKKDEHKTENGIYPFYNSTIHNHLYCDEFTNDDECLVINKVNGTGKCKIFYNNGKFSATSAVIIFKPKNNEILIKYLYYFLVMNKSIVESKYAGGDKKSLSNGNFETILIPNLPLTHQEEIVKFLDDQFTNYNISKLKKDIPLFKLLIEKDYDMAAELLSLVYRHMAAETETENIKRDIKSIFKLNVYGLNARLERLGDVVEIKRGKSLPKSNIITGEYPVIGGGVEYSGYHNEHNYDGNNGIFISRVGTAGHVSRYLNKCYITDLIFILEPKQIIYINYLFSYLKYNQKLIEAYRATNSAPNISWYNLQDFKIPIPSLQTQQDIIEKINKLNNQLTHYETYTSFLNEELTNIIKLIDNQTKLETNTLIDTITESDTIIESDSVIESDTNNEILVETIKQEQSTDEEIIKEITKTKNKIIKQKQPIDGKIIKVKKLTKTKT